MVIQNDDKVHQETVRLAEMTRQVAVTAAGGNQATVKAAEIAFYRACVASCLARGLSSSVFTQTLRYQFGLWS